MRSIAPGEEIEPEGVRGVSVRAVAAYNTSKRDTEGRVFHPREAGGVGYDVNVRGERLYHAGDTDVIPEMDAVAGVDVALLPVSGTYVMTAGEAAEAARRIQPRVAVPMHWGEHLGTREDALAFAGRRRWRSRSWRRADARQDPARPQGDGAEEPELAARLVSRRFPARRADHGQLDYEMEVEGLGAGTCSVAERRRRRSTSRERRGGEREARLRLRWTPHARRAGRRAGPLGLMVRGGCT